MSRIYLFPGQGSQRKGMGADVFPKFPEETATADAILGYSVAEQCIEDPGDKLSQTEYTQPLLFTVSALMYLNTVRESGNQPDLVAGHSVGEFAALFAAGVFDFATGLRLVQKRGELMSRAIGGGMAAVVGMTAEQIQGVLQAAGFTTIDVANLNSSKQSVISGLKDDVLAVQSAFEAAGAKKFVPLDVSGAFHSRYMRPSQAEFESFARTFTFAAPTIQVIANVTARPYEADQIVANMTRQITSPVRWVESMQYALEQPEPTFEEIGPGNVLTALLRQIKPASES
ncbi:MAG: ACP S-malonyltransferase [Acidobacteriota bacterium]|nr:ACP S-malonyltransferase [Acidobacteriota bacterium]